jgi:hypothetical protein
MENVEKDIPVYPEIPKSTYNTLSGNSCQVIIGIVVGFIIATFFYNSSFIQSELEDMWYTVNPNAIRGGGNESFNVKKHIGYMGDPISPYYSMDRTLLRKSGKNYNNKRLTDPTAYAVPYNDHLTENFDSDGTYDEKYLTTPGSIDVNMNNGFAGYGRNYGPPVLP